MVKPEYGPVSTPIQILATSKGFHLGNVEQCRAISVLTESIGHPEEIVLMHLISLLIFIHYKCYSSFAILGLILIFYKKICISKRLGVSQTAIEVLYDRWIMALFGLRKDDATLVLNRILPNSSIFGLWLVFFPSLFDINSVTNTMDILHSLNKKKKHTPILL